MMSVRVNFEIGHEASIRSKRTLEGFTHDWEVFIRGCDSDPSPFIERVVFHLHETFQKPKRAVKEPPYSVKESGYAGFVIPIDIYLKNRDEPKKIQFKYDLNLQSEGPAITKVQKEKYIFHNPSEEFRKRLLKGGGVVVNSSIETEKMKENETKLQLTGKPKLGADMMKKHKPKEHRSDESKISNFAHLFGTPINTGPKASPDPKKTSPVPPKTISTTSLKKDDRMTKEKMDKSKPKLSPTKEKDNSKNKELQDKAREEKRKIHNKDRDRSKEKLSKSSISPKPRSPKYNSPSLSTNTVNRIDSEQQKLKLDNIDSKKGVVSKDRKLKKEKKLHDRDKKDHKREKERDKDSIKETKLDPKILMKEKEPVRELVMKEKLKEKEKPISIKAIEPQKLEPESKLMELKSQDKKELEKKHKHKKKDKSRKEESKLERDKEKKSKLENSTVSSKLIREDGDSFHTEDNNIGKVDHESHMEPIIPDNLSDPGSSDSEESVKSVEESVIQKSDVNLNSAHDEYYNMDKQKDKIVKKHKDKTRNFDKEEKRRKRKSKDDHMEKSIFFAQPSKLVKLDEVNSDMDVESPDATEASEQAQTDTEPVPMEFSETDPPSSPPPEDKAFTPDYMSELKELQHKIMTLQDNTEIQDIVQMVAETGQFEITKKTFDFDLCTLDRSTVQRLQEFFASS